MKYVICQHNSYLGLFSAQQVSWVVQPNLAAKFDDIASARKAADGVLKPGSTYEIQTEYGATFGCIQKLPVQPRSVLQPWVTTLPFMQQSVLVAAIRAPDGLRKDHPVKVLMHWFRRCVLIRAFENDIVDDPFSAGGGSFTGPFTIEHAKDMGIYDSVLGLEKVFDRVRDVYLRHVDEMPHHFQLHFMHAAEIVGYKHPSQTISAWWLHFYRMIVNDAHLNIETEETMDRRLGDVEKHWRDAEESVTK